jgi:hypothetical protein
MEVAARNGDFIGGFGLLTPRTKLLVLSLLAAAIPVLTFYSLPLVPPLRTLDEPYAGEGSRFSSSPLGFTRREIGPAPAHHPLIANVQIVDFDGDGRNDILACDVRGQCVVLASRGEKGDWSERILAEDIATPAHATVVDLDQDGDRDLVVSVLGDILPNDGVIGRVIWLEQTPQGFTPHVLLDDVRRVADCQAADFDGDGDLDLAVAVFGYARGEILWLENMGEGRFLDHNLLSAPGTIHVPLADYDGDGDIDIAAIVSQDEEELWAFENLGGGKFRPRRLWFTVNFDIGSAGLVQDDLDQDGDPDLILPVGDNLEVTHSFPQPYHGCLWFENEGGWKFTPRRIARFGGTYAAAVGDFDADGDRDVALVSMFNNWDERRNASVVWLENDGRQEFRTWQIDSQPTHRVTVAVGDLDGDGRDDIVTGGLHLAGPFDRLGRLTVWFNSGK